MAIELDFLRQLDRFQMAMKKKVHAQYQGGHETNVIGGGLQFKDYREYVPGDDTRYIDWKVYARTDKFFIKRFEEERNMVVHIIVDASGSMNFGRKMTKFDFASMIGLGFAYMALKNNEKFNFNTFAESIDPIKAKKGMNQLMSIVSHLNDIKPEGKSDFKGSMDVYKKSITSKSVIVIISDFLYDIDEFRDIIQRYRKSEVVIVQVLDPDERNLTLQGDVILKDSELDIKIRTFISRRTVKHYQDKMGAHIANLRNVCEETDSTFISITTDQPVFDVFHTVLTGRAH